MPNRAKTSTNLSTTSLIGFSLVHPRKEMRVESRESRGFEMAQGLLPLALVFLHFLISVEIFQRLVSSTRLQSMQEHCWVC